MQNFKEKEKIRMTGLKRMLLEEKQRLEAICQKTNKRLENVPQGMLHLSSCKNQVQYYHYLPGEKKRGSYIPKANRELPCQLAQKSYDEKVLKLAARRLKQIQKILNDYEDEEIDTIFLKEKPWRQELIQPVEPIWEQKEKEWMEEPYERMEVSEDAFVILTEKGERVRSKSEKILADYFYRNGILYKYEKPLYLKGFGIVHPDFTFLSRKLKKEIYWEHHGRMDDPVYAQKAVKKIQAYEENGIYPGERLILTFETTKTFLNTRLMETLARQYLDQKPRQNVSCASQSPMVKSD